MTAKCSVAKREKGACFKCFQLGHKTKECPSRERSKNKSNGNTTEEKRDINSVTDERIGDFQRRISYKLKDSTGDLEVNLVLDTLLDMDSPISFVKEIFVPLKLIAPASQEETLYRGLNNSILNIRECVDVCMTLDDKKWKMRRC